MTERERAAGSSQAANDLAGNGVTADRSSPDGSSLPSRSIESVLIFGTGALASLVGARLARAGETVVTLAGSWPAALEAIARNGVTVEEDGAEWNAAVRSAEVGGRLPVADLVLVLVKSHQTASIAPHAAGAVAPHGLVLTLQNGLGNRQQLEAEVGCGRVAQGVTSMGAALIGPGHVRVGGDGLTILGLVPSTTPAPDGSGTSSPVDDAGPRADSYVQAIAELFSSLGMPTSVRADLDAIVWRKLVVSCAINPLTALREVPNGDLLSDWQSRSTLEAAAREVGLVAEAKGIDLGADPVDLAVEVASATADNLSSMLQDVLRGAPTEIDAINGAVVAEGARLGVPTPVNEWLHGAVLARENERSAELTREASAR